MSSTRGASGAGRGPVTGFGTEGKPAAASWMRPLTGRVVEPPRVYDEREPAAIRGFLEGVREAAAGED
nr:hypothetical protein [Streptomyces griseorubiginosus]